MEEVPAAGPAGLPRRSEKISSLLALNGIKKEAQFGIRTVLDVLDAEVEYLNASTNVIKSKADEIYSQFYIKSILGNLSIRDINREYRLNHDLKENNLNYEKTVLKLQTELDEVINFSLKNKSF